MMMELSSSPHDQQGSSQALRPATPRLKAGAGKSPDADQSPGCAPGAVWEECSRSHPGMAPQSQALHVRRSTGRWGVKASASGTVTAPKHGRGDLSPRKRSPERWREVNGPGRGPRAEAVRGTCSPVDGRRSPAASPSSSGSRKASQLRSQSPYGSRSTRAARPRAWQWSTMRPGKWCGRRN